MKSKTCKHCGCVIEDKKRTAEYCSDKCRLYAWRKRKSETGKKK